MSTEDSDRQIRLWATFIAEGLLVPIFGIIGIIGNILSVIVLSRRNLDLKPTFTNLLLTLCIYDVLFIIAVTTFYTLPIHSLYCSDFLVPYLTPFLLPFIHIVLTGSVYSVVSVALERYLIICRPSHNGHISNELNPNKGYAYIAFIVFFSLIYNVNKFFEVELESQTYLVKSHDNSSQLFNVTFPKVVISELRKNADYKKALIIVNFIFMTLIPLTILMICHIKTYRAIQESIKRHNQISSHQRRDNAMAKLFFIIILIFVICHSGKLVANLYEMYLVVMNKTVRPWPVWASLTTRINHVLLVINSSVNFFIYCFRDGKFRQELLSVLRIPSTGSPGQTVTELEMTNLANREEAEDVEV